MDARTEATLLALAEQIQKYGSLDDLMKAFTLPATSTQGLIAYDLEAPSKKLFPVITPLRNRIPRVGGGLGLATNWRAVTAIDVNSVVAGVSEGNRGGVMSTTIKEFVAKYVTMGLEDYVSFEMDSASRTFEDVKALAVENLLKALMIQEENGILGWNNSIALGTPATPTLAAPAGSDGSLTAATGGLTGGNLLNVRVVALTHPAFLRSKTGVGGGVPMTLTRTNADSSSDVFGGGSSKISANVASSAVSANQHVDASVTPVAGAVAYAWFWGSDTGANQLLGAITTINSVRITANAAGATSVPSGFGSTAQDFTTNNTDNSTNTLVYDGLISIINGSNSGAYYRALGTGTPGTGTGLTSDGGTGVAEFNTAFRYFWDTYRLGPTEIIVNAQEMQNLIKLVLANGGAPIVRFVGDINRSAPGYGANNDWGGVPPASITAGAIVGQVINPFTMSGGNLVPIRLHPSCPPGTVLFWTDTLPYPLSNVAEIMRIKTRRDYYQLEWPLRSRKYEYGVYAESVLQCYAPFAFGMLTNVGNT